MEVFISSISTSGELKNSPIDLMDQPVHRALAKETTSPRQVPPTPIVTTVFQATEDVPKYDKQSSATWILRCSEKGSLWKKRVIMISLEAPSRWTSHILECWTPEYPPENDHISRLPYKITFESIIFRLGPVWVGYGRTVPWENILHSEVPFEGFKWNLQMA